MVILTPNTVQNSFLRLYIDPRLPRSFDARSRGRCGTLLATPIRVSLGVAEQRGQDVSVEL